MSRMSESYARSPLPLSPPLMEACLRHNWPANLRELSNFIKRYLVLGDETLAASELQPGPMAVEERTSKAEAQSLARSLAAA